LGRAFEGLDFLLRHKADPNKQDGTGRTALHYATAMGMLEVRGARRNRGVGLMAEQESLLLVEHGARTDIMDNARTTAVNKTSAIIFNAIEGAPTAAEAAAVVLTRRVQPRRFR
jgi:hypothetical protein